MNKRKSSQHGYQFSYQPGWQDKKKRFHHIRLNRGGLFAGRLSAGYSFFWKNRKAAAEKLELELTY